MSDLLAHFRLAARNNRYANAVMAKACAALGEDGLWAPGVSFFPSIGETLNHILEIDLYYLDALECGGLGRKVYDQFEALRAPADLAAAQEAADMRLIAFCDALTDTAALVPTERSDGRDWPERIDALLTHLFAHDVHHRGQAHAMLAGTGVAPPQLDDFYLEYGRTPIARAALAL
ncbi:MAG: DinB family protein [Pseudomonadota bacterium]